MPLEGGVLAGEIRACARVVVENRLPLPNGAAITPHAPRSLGSSQEGRYSSPDSSWSLLRLSAVALQAAPALVLSFVEYFLLVGREYRADLRHCVVHQRFNFLHRISANGLYLRIRLVNDRLDLRFLFRREI